MEIICTLCKLRISDWCESTGKTIHVDGKVYHKICLIDYYLRTGRQFLGEKDEKKAS